MPLERGKRDGGDGEMEGSRFKRWRGGGRGMLGSSGASYFTFNIFLFLLSRSLSLVFGIVTCAALKSRSFIKHVPVNILNSTV